jgi:hypothetical protein
MAGQGLSLLGLGGHGKQKNEKDRRTALVPPCTETKLRQWNCVNYRLPLAATLILSRDMKIHCCWPICIFIEKKRVKRRRVYWIHDR